MQAKHVRHGVESGAVAPWRHLPTFEQNQEILQSKLITFACTHSITPEHAPIKAGKPGGLTFEIGENIFQRFFAKPCNLFDGDIIEQVDVMHIRADENFGLVHLQAQVGHIAAGGVYRTQEDIQRLGKRDAGNPVRDGAGDDARNR